MLIIGFRKLNRSREDLALASTTWNKALDEAGF